MAEPGILTKEEANAKIAAFVALAYAALADAETLADDYGLAFSFSPAYGMGGWYASKEAYLKDNYGADYSSDPDWEDSSSEENYGWQSSSSNC